MFLVLLTEVDHWKREGDDTSAPSGKHWFHPPTNLMVGEINSLAQGHSVDKWWSGGKFGQLDFRGYALPSKEVIFKVCLSPRCIRSPGEPMKAH